MAEKLIAAVAEFRQTDMKRTWTDEQFIESAKKRISASAVLRDIGLSVTGSNFGTVRTTVKRLGLDVSHWLGQRHMKGRRCTWNKKWPTEKMLTAGSLISRRSLKVRLLREGILKNECARCRQSPEWQGEKLVMVLDHINGISDDNQRENLRLLCPNCNSQQPTFSGKNKRGKTLRIVKENLYCEKCGRVLSCRTITGRCSMCIDRKKTAKRKEIPQSLMDDIKNMGVRATARKYSVSPLTIRRWHKAHVPELE